MKDTAYLVVHGFGGSLAETNYLVEYLRARGLSVYTPLLPGHGGTKKDLKNTDYTAWVDHVRATAFTLAEAYRQIVYLGFSMGGLLGTFLTDIPQVQKFVLINTPIYFWSLNIIAADVFSGLWRRDFEKWRYYRRAVGRISIKSSFDFLKILSLGKKQIAGIERPTLLIQCKRDETAFYRSAQYIRDKIPDFSVLRYYDGGCHSIFEEASPLREEICFDVYAFLTG